MRKIKITVYCFKKKMEKTMRKKLLLRHFSTSLPKTPIPIPHRTLPLPLGHDQHFLNLTHSHIVNSNWSHLTPLSPHFTPLRLSRLLLSLHNDPVLSLRLFTWAHSSVPSSLSLLSLSLLLHSLSKHKKFSSFRTHVQDAVFSDPLNVPIKLFYELVGSYRLCGSTPLVFDSLFRTLAKMRKFRGAHEVFCLMRDYGFFPTVESCNVLLSELVQMGRGDIVLRFYGDMRKSRISPNVYTVNLVMCGLCKLGKVEKAEEMFRKMETMGISANVVSYNTLIAGFCSGKGLIRLALKFKNLMRKNGLEPNVVTFNSLIHGFCREGRLSEANKVFSEMKLANLVPNVVTYNTLINGYSQVGGSSEMGSRVFDEMLRDGVKPDILTYNALILGLCKEGKTKKAAYMVKELDKHRLAPNAATFSALIVGQCVRKNPDRAFQLYRCMVRSGFCLNEDTFKMMISTFCQNEDYEGAFQVALEMLEKCMSPGFDILREIHVGLCQDGKDHLAKRLSCEMKARQLMPECVDHCETILPEKESNEI